MEVDSPIFHGIRFWIPSETQKDYGELIEKIETNGGTWSAFSMVEEPRITKDDYFVTKSFRECPAEDFETVN